MRARDAGRRLLVGVASLALLAGCGASATPTPKPATATPVSLPSMAATPAPTQAVAAATPGFAATPVPPSGPAGSMTTGRAWHTATLLPDGRVLLTGGYDISAELYDPASGAFSATGSLPADLSNQTASLLADGRVLVAGGGPGGSPLALAELYDPGNATFSPTGPMTVARASHTATVLADGRVLIAGGDTAHGNAGQTTLASAEVYDPKTGTFSPTGSMTIPRTCATATLLADGRVLVAGGNPDDWGMASSLASAEMYDPATGTFSATGSMHKPRCDATSTLLPDGRVLVAGGFFITAGTGMDASAELYDPKTGTFSLTGPMATARAWHTSTLLGDGRVLVTGGVSGASASSVASAELYDPKTGTFGPTGAMAVARAGHTATQLADGRVLVAGGSGCDDVDGCGAASTGFNYLASAELYDPKTGTFSATGAVWSTTIGRPADDGARIVAVTTVDARTRDLTIESPAVGLVKVRLLLPSQFGSEPSTRWPLLYLLTGSTGSHLDWTDNSDVETLTAPTDLLVVMPDAADNGWYSDWWNGGAGGPPKWETFHLVELRQLLERNWHAGDKRVIAGLSMGGYGAMEYAARHPGMFLAAASFSGALDPVGLQAGGFDVANALWGDVIAQADVWKAHDPLDNVAALKGTALYVAYGNGALGPLDSSGAVSNGEDGLATVGQAFVHALAARHIPVTVYAYGAGTHSWPYWQRDLHRWLPLALKALGE